MLYVRLFLVLALLLFAAPSFSAPVMSSQNKLGVELHLPIIEWSDSAAPRKGIIIALHSLLLSAASYENYAQHLASDGYTVYALDIRGFGRWRTEFSKFETGPRADFTAAKSDLVRMITKLRADNPTMPIILMGESMGADLAIAILSQPQARLVDGAVLCAPGFKIQVRPTYHIPVDILTTFYQPRKKINFDYYLETYLSKNGEVTKNWRTDTSITHTISLADLVHDAIMSHSALRDASRIPPDMPLLVMGGENDQVFVSSQIPKEVKRFGSRNVAAYVLANKGHLLLEAQPVDKQTSTLVETWLARHATPRGSVIQATVSRPSSAD
jgi:alpha-beta hydrolase superfamily lysophospholipase